MKQGYRIISIEAADIYRHEQENRVSVGYKMPENKSDAYFRLFKIYLDNSLDLIELEKAYKRICRKKFSFQDKSENEYTIAVINLKFNYTYKSENGKPIKIKDLRSHFYENGFYLDGVHYVRYKRIVTSPAFKEFSRERALPIGCVAEKEGGEFTVYGKQFARIW